MKKILFFLITILFISNIQVLAKEPSFYEAEYIDNIYMNKVMNNTIYYQKARFFRDSSTHEAVYCIEPEIFFNPNETYQETTTSHLTSSQEERIRLLAYYGYNYENHTDKKWYAITQFLIWQTSYPEGKYYFTDTLNGNKIEQFTNEINEIENLISNHYKKPSFDSKTKDIVYDNSLAIIDSNKVLENYNVITDNATIYKNVLSINKLEPGTHEIKLEKKGYYQTNQKIYTSKNSQNLISIGNIQPVTSSININVDTTKIKIIKVDQETQKTTPQGDSSLIGATFEIYSMSNTKLKEVTLEEETLNIDNLNYGRYYILEKTPGIGYKLNNNKYEFEINKSNKNILIKIDNKVIKKEIEINKLFGSNDNFQPEKNISFNIYNSKNEFLTTIKTNDQGQINITLPYGTYTIKQLTTTEGYQKVNPIKITVDNEEKEIITLKNYKINVPNTYTTDQNIFIKLVNYIKQLCQTINLY